MSDYGPTMARSGHVTSGSNDSACAGAHARRAQVRNVASVLQTVRLSSADLPSAPAGRVMAARREWAVARRQRSPRVLDPWFPLTCPPPPHTFVPPATLGRHAEGRATRSTPHLWRAALLLVGPWPQNWRFPQSSGYSLPDAEMLDLGRVQDGESQQPCNWLESLPGRIQCPHQALANASR